MNFGEVVFRGWIEANNLHPVSLIEKVEAISRLGAAMVESDLASVKRQNTYLATYYYREALKAEADHYPLPEFFDSCRAIISKVEVAIRAKYMDEKIKQSRIKAAAMAGNITYADDNGLPYEQRLKETIESCNEYLQNVDVSEFTQPLDRITNGMIGGHIGIEQLNRIADALKTAQQRCVDANNIVKTTCEPQPTETPNPYPELFKKGGFELFTYLFQNITEIKPKTRANVLFHGVRNGCFTDTATHKSYIAFLKKEYNVSTSKISTPNFKGQDFIKETLPQMVGNYEKQKKEVVEK